MAYVSHRRAQHLGARRPLCALPLGIAVLALAATAAAPAHSEPVDLIGTWHVLIHFTDDHTHDPALMRWDDRVWVFEPAGSRLEWTEYPIVVFRDQSGRFEARQGMRAARTLHGWEPNAAQREQIADGIPVSERGRKRKALRKRGDGWQSASRSTAASASIVSYVEHWSIGGPAGLPVFRREDVLGSAETDGVEGVTQYTTTEVLAGGDELRGTFLRDESRRGTFRMRRSGAPKAAKGQQKTEGQRFHEEFLGTSFDLALDREGSALREAVSARGTGRGEVSAELRTRARAEITAAIAERIRESGDDPSRYEREVRSLAEKIEAALIDEGRSFHDVVEMLKDGRINP